MSIRSGDKITSGMEVVVVEESSLTVIITLFWKPVTSFKITLSTNTLISWLLAD